MLSGTTLCLVAAPSKLSSRLLLRAAQGCCISLTRPATITTGSPGLQHHRLFVYQRTGLHRKQQQQQQRQCRRSSFFAPPSATMRNQAALVDHLKSQGVIKHNDVESAMRQVDRRHYLDCGIPTPYAYQDSPLPIGYHETISAPHMHATCLELLREHLREGARVLDVGSGSGYLAAAMGLMVWPTGKVVGIEKHLELAEKSVANVRADHPELLDDGVVVLRAGNVLGDALEGEEAFDAIHVGAAASSLPETLLSKLAKGGRMVIPVGPQWEYQVMQCIDRDAEGEVQKHDLMYVRYVPLTEPGDTSW